MKESYYFPHDHNARNDERVLKIRSQFNNAEGYGIYFMVIEVLAESSDGSIDASDMAPLSLSLSLPKDKLEAFLALSISLGLFKKKGDRIYSDRMNEYKKFREERSESGRKGARSRWDSINSSAIAQPLLEPMLIKGKERKGKESKENDFDAFYKAYPKKVGKDAARSAWNKKNPPLSEVLTALEQQKKMDQWSKNDGQFIPNPATWLNHGRWKDEISNAEIKPMLKSLGEI